MILLIHSLLLSLIQKEYDRILEQKERRNEKRNKTTKVNEEKNEGNNFLSVFFSRRACVVLCHLNHNQTLPSECSLSTESIFDVLILI